MNNASFPFPKVIITTLTLLLLLLLSTQNKLDYLVTPTNLVLKPLRLPFYTLNQITTRQFNFFRSIPHQQRLVDDLKRQNQELLIISSQVNNLKQENELLKQSLNSPVLKQRSLLTVRIISLSRYATVDKGSNDSIKVGQALVSNNLLLGIVTTTSSNTAKVKLLTDPDFTLNVTTQAGTTGTIKSINNTLVVTDLPQSASINQNEPLVTKGDEFIPPGLVVAKVNTITSNQSSIHQTLTLTPAIQITDINTALVILN